MYSFLKILSKIACLLPRGICEILGRGIAVIAWLFVPQRRKKMAIENVIRCLSVDETEANRIARASALRFGPMLFEVLRFPVLKAQIEDYVKIEGLEHLQKALARGRGAVIATSHSGNWELLGGALAQAGIPLVGVAMKQKDAGADRFINEYRAWIGMHITYKTGVREMFDMLRQGHVIGLLSDQDTDDGILLEFLGRTTNCVQGAAVLARFQDAPIVTAFIRRNADGTHIVEISEAFLVERTKDKKADIRKTTQRIADATAENIRAYPEEWFWLHDRWKSVRKMKLDE